ncbi:hypothetical protein [Maritalea sp.]|uniref:hypothetical protein n=1 Tax=Maritalea sp. TaxID=2003361 RepID=UPI003EF75F09
MSKHEDEQRKRVQQNALDIHHGSGSLIIHQHLDRQQEVVAVTRDDLEDVLSFDSVGALFGALGTFLLSGAGWLLVEKYFGDGDFIIDGLVGFCLAAAIFGVVSLFAGLLFFFKKRGRIKRIFAQTKPR